MNDLLAQLVELRTFNAKVADSNSAGVTKLRFLIEPYIYICKLKIWFEWKIVKNVVKSSNHKKD